jgi:hypothetical protein
MKSVYSKEYSLSSHAIRNYLNQHFTYSSPDIVNNRNQLDYNELFIEYYGENQFRARKLIDNKSTVMSDTQVFRFSKKKEHYAIFAGKMTDHDGKCTITGKPVPEFSFYLYFMLIPFLIFILFSWGIIHSLTANYPVMDQNTLIAVLFLLLFTFIMSVAAMIIYNRSMKEGLSILELMDNIIQEHLKGS